MATLIVTLHTTDGFEATKRKILKIRGVNDVELNYISRKLRVRYGGRADENEEILFLIQSVIPPHTQ
jgi:hypothetical protein